VKVLVIGGSHGVGREVVRQAAAAGHSVTVFSRRPERAGLTDPRLALFPGSVLITADVEAVVPGHDAIICTLGIPTGSAIGLPGKRHPVLSAGTKNLVDAAQRHGSKRVILLTAIGAGDSRRNLTTAGRLGLRLGLPYLYAEKDRQEQTLRASSLDWTIVRPTALTDGPQTGTYGVHNYPGGPAFTSGLLTHISRADVAGFIVGQLGKTDHLGHAVTLSYPARFGDSLRWIANFRAR